jgi:hypothetical protein
MLQCSIAAENVGILYNLQIPSQHSFILLLLLLHIISFIIHRQYIIRYNISLYIVYLTVYLRGHQSDYIQSPYSGTRQVNMV